MGAVVTYGELCKVLRGSTLNTGQDLSALYLVGAGMQILIPDLDKASSSSAAVVVAAVALFSIAAVKHLTFTLIE